MIADELINEQSLQLPQYLARKACTVRYSDGSTADLVISSMSPSHWWLHPPGDRHRFLHLTKGAIATVLAEAGIVEIMIGDRI